MCSHTNRLTLKMNQYTFGFVIHWDIYLVVLFFFSFCFVVVLGGFVVVVLGVSFLGEWVCFGGCLGVGGYCYDSILCLL